MHPVEDQNSVRLGGVKSDPLHPSSEDAAPLPYRNWEGQPPPAPPGAIEVPRGSYYEPPGHGPAFPSSPCPPELAGLSSELLHPSLQELRPARGGRKPRKKQVVWEVIRSLTPEDIELLNTTLPAPRQTLTQIRHSHHQLAQLLAEGRPQGEAALLTGYSPTYVSILKDDPTFKELCAYYATQTEMIFVDVLERMKSLGLSTLDELQSRLEADPSDFSNRELLEQAELMLVKPMVATRGGILPGQASGPSVATGGVQVNVNFIGHASPQPQPSDLQTNRPVSSKTVDAEPGDYTEVQDDDKRRANGHFKYRGN